MFFNKYGKLVWITIDEPVLLTLANWLRPLCLHQDICFLYVSAAVRLRQKCYPKITIPQPSYQNGRR